MYSLQVARNDLVYHNGVVLQTLDIHNSTHKYIGDTSESHCTLILN